MHERQRLVDSEEKRDLYDPNSPLSERDADLDRVLFNHLVQIVSLVQSFIVSFFFLFPTQMALIVCLFGSASKTLTSE